MNLYEKSYRIYHFTPIATILYEKSYRLTYQAIGLRELMPGRPSSRIVACRLGGLQHDADWPLRTCARLPVLGSPGARRQSNLVSSCRLFSLKPKRLSQKGPQAVRLPGNLPTPLHPRLTRSPSLLTLPAPGFCSSFLQLLVRKRLNKNTKKDCNSLPIGNLSQPPSPRPTRLPYSCSSPVAIGFSS